MKNPIANGSFRVTSAAPAPGVRPSRGGARHWPGLMASVTVHLLVLLAWQLAPRAAGTLPRQIERVMLALPSHAELRGPSWSGGSSRARLPVHRRAPAAADTEASAPAPVAEGPPPADTVASPHRVESARIVPGLGDGRLWVRPLSPDELASVHRLTRSTAELADSVTKATIRGYLDSLALEMARRPGPPSWTGTIGGAKFGLDSRYVYLAGLRIPNVVLALLPIPATGNQSRAFDRSGAMFEDLERAAVRSAILDDIKAAIRDLRAQSELEHRLREAQRSPPAPEEAPMIGSP